MFNISKKNIIVLIIFFLIFSLFFFSKKRSIPVYEKNKQQIEYEEIKRKINSQESKNLNKVENFIVKNNNIYGTLIAMELAKKYILNNNLDKAFTQLNHCLEYTKENNLKNILQLRMTKIKIQKNEYNQAMNIIKSITDKNWKNIVEHIKGDIFAKQNKNKEAIKCWKKSLLIESLNASREILRMKINELK